MSFEVGDKVFDMLYGIGEVAWIGNDSLYPINVRFLNNRSESYTLKGKNLIYYATITLYHSKPEIIAPPEPTRLPDLALDTPILVRICNNKKWRKRHFKCWFGGRCVTWDGGGTSWSAMTSSNWTEWELPEDAG